MSNLKNLYFNNNYNTDKYNLGYFDLFYEDIFFSLKNRPINLLEIGVFGGGSIKLWKDYLHEDSKICAADINLCNEIENLKNVRHIVCDAYNQSNLHNFEDNHYDLIIDDGPHTYQSFEFLVENYHSKLKDNGTMIIEDIIDLSWTSKLISLAKKTGYVNIKHINAAGKQKTEHLLSLWTKGLDVLILKK